MGVHGGSAGMKTPSGLPSRLLLPFGREKVRQRRSAARGGRASGPEEGQLDERRARGAAAARLGAAARAEEQPAQAGGGARARGAGRGRAPLLAAGGSRAPAGPARRLQCRVSSPRKLRVPQGLGYGPTGPGDGVGAALTPVLRASGEGRAAREGGRRGARGRCHLLQRRPERGGGLRRGGAGRAGLGPACAPSRRAAAASSRAGGARGSRGASRGPGALGSPAPR